MVHWPSDRALQVCTACKVRKRACDKSLPRCGYCVKKGQSCRYQAAAEASLDGNRSASLQDFSAGTSGRTTLDERVEWKVREMLRLTAQSVDEVSRKFFTGFQTWLPVVSPVDFYDALIEQSSGEKPPPASLSMLLMNMVLITLPPGTAPSLLEPLYTTVKTTSAELLARDGSTLSSLQSALLVTAYEYACDRIDSAYLTIGTCIRIGYALRLNSRSHKIGEVADDEATSLEELNSWWGILILERMIVCEMPPDRRHLMTSIPTRISRWPADFEDQSRSSPLLYNNEDESSPDSASNDLVSNYGYHAQAAQLLDDVLTLCGGSRQKDARPEEMESLDADLTAFLIALMTPASWRWGIHCGAIGTCIRALYILHRWASSNATQDQEYRHSQTLNSITTMVLDIADLHANQIGLSQIYTTPLSNPHNMRQAAAYLRTCQESEYTVERENALKTLAGMMSIFRQKWTPPGDCKTE